MAPVQNNSVLLGKQSTVHRVEALQPDESKIKDEPPDEDCVLQDEDFRGWDTSSVKSERENYDVPCAELVPFLDATDEDTVRCSASSKNEPKVLATKPDCSRGEAQLEYSASLLLDNGLSMVESDGMAMKRFNNGKSINRNSVAKEFSTSSHVCSECGKSFAQASKLAHHLKIHSADKPFRCSDCGKYFALQQHLDWHSRIHTEGSYYCCPVCRRKFTEQTNLSRHLLKTHPAEKPYKCFECGKPFVQASALKRHLKVHDNAMALEEIGRVDSMFLVEESNLKAIEDLQKKKASSKNVEEKLSPSKEQNLRDLKLELISKDREVENNLPCLLQNDKQVKKLQIKSKHQKKQLTEIGAKLKRIKNFISSEEQRGRAILGAQVYNSHFDSSSEPLLNGKDIPKKKRTSPEKLPLKGNGTNMDSRFNPKGEDYIRVRQNQARFGKSNVHDMHSESFSCRNCGENFRSKASLYNHVMCHIGMKLHDCSMCGKHFSETLSLERHYIYHITGSFPQECLRCGRHFFSYHDLRDHSQTHLADKKRGQRPLNQFKCNKCRRNFPSFRILEAHIRSRCLEDRRPGRFASGMKFPSMKNRENSDNHMVVDVDPHLAFPAAGYMSDGSSKEEFHLSESEKFLGAHTSNFQREGMEIMGEESEDRVCSSPSEEMEEFSLGMLDCAECGKKVPGIEAMMLHIKEHVAEKTNLKCPVLKCGKLFKDSKDFQAHIRAHAGEKPYRCSQCNKSFYLKENYDKHMNRHQTWGSIATIIGESPAAGNHSAESAKVNTTGYCNRLPWQQNSINQSVSSQQFGKHPPSLSVRHPIILGKQQLYPLKQSSQAMSASVMSMAAQNSRSDVSPGHTQKERMCASALVQLFRVSDSINALNVGSSEYRRYPRSGQCEVCLKFCSRLDKHMMVHLGQKPHLCPMCPQAFRQSEHLKRHVRARHEGNHRVFECPLCLKKLTRKDKLKEHMRNCRKIMAPLSPSPLPIMPPMPPISDRLFDVIPGPSR